MDKLKRILITGITGNLGQATEALFDDYGWFVVGVSRGTGLDLTDWQAVDAFIEDCPAFDIVFMTHGTQQKVMISEFSPETWSSIVGNNLESAAILSATLVRHRKIAPGGLVVYCSSIQATQPRAGRGLYALAKAGIEGLTRAMAVELAPHGRAIALRLGQMETTMKGVVFTEADINAILPYTPLPWVLNRDTAQLVYNLYHQLSISGEVIEVSSMHKFSVWPQ